MPTPPSPEELPPEKALHLIAQAIDDAADRADDDLNSQALKWCDQIESRLGSDAQRSLLYQMDRAIQSLTAKGGSDDEVSTLIGVYHNLLRQWSET